MALIIDPDLLNQWTEITITAATKTIKLNVAGNLSSDWVTLKTIYSFLKEEWKNDANLQKYPFPMTPITDEQFEFSAWWNLDKTGSGSSFTPNLVRTGWWAVKNTSWVTIEERAGVVTLGTVQAGGQVYMQQSSWGSATNFNLTWAVNQAVQIYSDPNGDWSTADWFNYRAYLKLFLREQANVYASSQLSDIWVSSMTYQVYRFPLSDSDDVKVTQPDVTVDAYGVTITWYATTQTISIGWVNRDFHVIIDWNNKTAEEIYMAVQSLLRKATDIDSWAGTKTGKLTNELVRFVGDTLYTKLDSTWWVYIQNFQPTDTNRIVFVDDTNTERTYPFVAVITLNIGSNLQTDTDAVYRVFFTNDDAWDNTGRDFGTSSAITVNDNSAVAMAWPISWASTITLTYNYDGNVQRWAASAGLNAPITVIGIGLTTWQYVSATGTITRSISNSISLVAPLERNYLNP